jgi:NAD(P)-dependent dehydrogenase (short-subunit alcohol dehydrogenase family)
MSVTAAPDVTDRDLAELLSLRGRRAVVTGGARGLGAAIARRLAEADATVLIGDLDATAAEALAGDLGVHAAPLDVTDTDSVTAFADLAVDRLGGIDVWVNNAGVYPSAPLLDLSDDEWDRVVDVNLRGTFVASREAARRMIDGGRRGVIVNIASVAGLGGRGPGVPHYVATKHGVVGLTKQMAIELAPHGIRVVGVAPSQVLTPGVEAAWAARGSEPQVPLSPLGRPPVVDDVARMVVVCAGDLAVMVNGTTIPVDGGEIAR